MHNDAMETLIIQVDCRPHGRDGPPQLGITVEDPVSKKDSHKRDALEQKRVHQRQASSKDYIDHDYQNLDNGNFNRLDNGNRNSRSNNNSNSNNNKPASVTSQRPVKNGISTDHSRTNLTNGLQQAHRGLQITQIQPGSVIDRNGQFKIGDIIAEVNGVNLQRSFAEAQRMLKQFVVEHTSHGPLVLKVFRKAVSPSTSSSSSESRHLVGALNTRKIGVKHRIKLRKAVSGFGIKIAERDNMHGTRHRPIFITAITTTGSAYQDGRLKEGDMLLEVNGIDLFGKSQPEVTKMLKAVAANEEVEFVVSRQESHSAEVSPAAGPGVYTYDIPLNDTKSAGLGLYLKYPRRTEDHMDLGIWVEKVITGGAAWKDGRLLPDDQILAINGINLLELSNAEASETLTAAVCRGVGPEATPNTIRLKVNRRSPGVVEKILQGTNNGTEHFDVIPAAAGQEQTDSNKSYGATMIAADKKVNNSQDSYLTAFDNTLQNNTLQKSHNKTTTTTTINLGNSSGSSSNLNSRSDSVMSPQTQASNSLGGLTSSYTEKSTDMQQQQHPHQVQQHHTQNNSEKTSNETTSSAISQITDSNSQSWDDESTDAPAGEDPFQRDGFGRQSISEKRHAQLSAWSTDTFRRNQRMREEQEQQRQLEEQMARQCFEVAVDVHMPPPPKPQPQLMTAMAANNERVARNRKINDSFRKAVDRSYEDGINVAAAQTVPSTYDLSSIRRELSVDRLDTNSRRISAGSKVLSSVANSTGSTANEERNLIASSNNISSSLAATTRNGGQRVVGAQESKLNDNNNNIGAHKSKSSSLLNKLLKFGSIKRKKKNSNKDKTTTTAAAAAQGSRVEAPRAIEMTKSSSRNDVSNPQNSMTRKSAHMSNNINNINGNTQEYSHIPTSQQQQQQANHHYLHQQQAQFHPAQQHPFAMYPQQRQQQQQQMQLSTPSDQMSGNLMHPSSSLYSSGRSAQMMMNSHAPHLNGRQIAPTASVQHPGAQWQSSHFQSPSGLWVTNSLAANDVVPPQLPPHNVYATLPHNHSQLSHHHHHIQQQQQQHHHHHLAPQMPHPHHQHHHAQQTSNLAAPPAQATVNGGFMPTNMLGNNIQQPAYGTLQAHHNSHHQQNQQHLHHSQHPQHQQQQQQQQYLPGQPFGAQPVHASLQHQHQYYQQQPQHISYYDF